MGTGNDLCEIPLIPRRPIEHAQTKRVESAYCKKKHNLGSVESIELKSNLIVSIIAKLPTRKTRTTPVSLTTPNIPKFERISGSLAASSVSC